MKTYADTVTAAHELQTYFALKATSEEKSAFDHTLIIRQGDTLYKQVTSKLSGSISHLPRYYTAQGKGKWEHSTASDCYAALVQI